MRLFIAEKPSMGKTIAEFLSKVNGIKASPTKTHITVGDDVVTWQFGHLFELAKPEKYDPRYEKWTFSDLPIVPTEWKHVPKRESADQIKKIGELLKECSEVVHAGDPDAEGQALVDIVLNNFKNKKPTRRLWAAALDDKSLSKAMSSMKDNSEYKNLFNASQARSNADWLFGMNMSRACSINARKKGADFVISVGRVQTPTLALIVNRELEIRNFKAKDYFTPWLQTASIDGLKVKATWDPEDGDQRLDADGKLLDKKLAESIAEKVKRSGSAKVVDYVTEPGSEGPPGLFSLSSLQTQASKLYGFSGAQTLELAQSLYDKKLTSYPRTDCEFMPESQFADASKLIVQLGKTSLPTSFSNAIRGAKPALKSKAWNDKNVSAHHAIVPVEANPAQIASLPENEKKIYFEIAKRYILQFWPAAKYTSTQIRFESESEFFRATGKVYQDEGWKKAFKVEKNDEDEIAEEENALPPMAKGQKVGVSETGVTSTTTKPPKRFTEGTLLKAMENIHQYVSDPNIKKHLKGNNGTGMGENVQAGIGTVATRAGIIKNLFDKGFVANKGKKEIIPTENGEKIIGILPATLTTPDMTAIWQKFMDSILKGESSYDAFMEKQKVWISEMVKSSTSFFDNVEFKSSKNGSKGGSSQYQIEDTGSACSCGQHINKVSGGKYGDFYACSSKPCGKRYDLKEGSFVEKMANKPVISEHSCPACSAGMRMLNGKNGAFWGCSNYGSKTPCKTTLPDLDGKPDFSKYQDKSGSSARGGVRGTGFQTKAVRT